ncbi:rod shape-determining protein MreC [Burkholderiaceae bacterium DAT-1]|nr:rod shape-determining protein MreC [Burkholderiaceae bacterium DAT-1]
MQSTNQPAFFKQGPKPLHRFMLYATLSIVLVVVDHRMNLMSPVRKVVSVALYPLQWLATAPVAGARQAADFLSMQAVLLKENHRLQQEKLQVNAQLLRMDALEVENRQLRALLAVPRAQNGKGILTEVLYYARDPSTAKLIVDRGSSDGIAPGMPVIDVQGIAGQVVRVQPLTSEVELVTDNNHAVPIQVLRSGVRAIIYGRGRLKPLEVQYMPANADFQVGDTLVTSGIDGIYPAGLPVAKVASVDRSSDFARITCSPIAGVDQGRFLLVLDEHRKLPEKPVVEIEEPKPGKKRKRGGEE